MCKSPVRESKRPTRRSRVKKCPVDTFLGRGRVEISKPPTIVREKLRQRQKGLGVTMKSPRTGIEEAGRAVPADNAHGGFLRIVTSLTRPVSLPSRMGNENICTVHVLTAAARRRWTLF